MKKFAAICLLLLASLHARADLTVIENIQVAGQGQDLTMKLKGDKARVDMGNGQMSLIIDVVSGDTIMLNHPQKMLLKISGDKAKAMISQMKKSDPDTEPPKIVDTGKKEKIGDYDTEIYTADTAEMKCTIWVTKGITDYANVQAQLNKMQALQKKFGQSNGPDLSKIDGVPVKTEIVKGGVTTTVSLTAINQDAIDDSALLPPTDYTEMPMPDITAGPGGGAPPAPPQPAPPAPAPQP